MSPGHRAQRLSPDTPQVPLLYPIATVVLTGLVVSLPRLPLLLRLPISVCELDCDIPSKKGLWRRSTARVSAARAAPGELGKASVQGGSTTWASRTLVRKVTAEAQQVGAQTKGLQGESYQDFCQRLKQRSLSR